MSTRKLFSLMVTAATLLAAPSYATTPGQYCKSLGAGVCEILDITATSAGSTIAQISLIKYCKNQELRFIKSSGYHNGGSWIERVLIGRTTPADRNCRIDENRHFVCEEIPANSHGSFDVPIVSKRNGDNSAVHTIHDHWSDATLCPLLP